MRPCVRSIAAALFLLLFAQAPLSAPAAGAVRTPVNYRDYDAWNTIKTPHLSDDGRYLAYALTPDHGDPTLVVRDLETGAERREPRGTAPQFTADSQFVVYIIAPPQAETDAAKRAKKPDAQQPKSGLGVLSLRDGRLAAFTRVKSVRVGRDGARCIAFRYEPPVSAKAPGRAGDADADPKKKADGGDLAIYDPAAGTADVIPDVTDYALADDGRRVAYARESPAGKADGIYAHDCVAGITSAILTGPGRYAAPAIARDSVTLGFLGDVRSYTVSRAPRYDAYIANLGAAVPAARLAITQDSPGLPLGAAPSADGGVTFSKDSRRMFVGTAPAPAPQPSDTPVPVAVDLWTYKDLRLQSQQQHDAPDDRKRTFRAVYDVVDARFAQLGSPRLADITTNENPRVALGLDTRPYAIASSWTGDEAADVYAVSLRDGSQRCLIRGVVGAALSPSGTYALVWDRALRHWTAIRTRDGKRTVLARAAAAAFYDETDDHPAPPPPYGTGGWLAGDRGVLLYDRYDIWLADPATGHATNLTRGAGRAANTVYSVLNTDPDRDAFPRREPLLLSLRDQGTFASGFARVPAGGGVPVTLLRADKLLDIAGGPELHDRVLPPLRARHAERYVFSEETFRAFRDLWTSGRDFERPVKVTAANPQLAHLRWGHESLIAYRSARGVPLRAVLLTPDGFDPHKRYPLLVYFYERWSDQFHRFYSPVPGYPTISRYVSHGYVVLLPDVWYRTGHPGDSAVDCILAGVDAVSRRGFIDPHRIGIAGHSWAGYQINYLITRTNRFRAAEAGAAVANMTSAYGGIRLESGIVREFQYERSQSRIGATPWDRPDLYLENSGLFHIENIHTPYLTMHNDADTAVPFEQGVEFITAMRRLHKPAYLFVFNGKEHNLRDTPADRDDLLFWTVHFDEWFDYWLMGAPRPAWFDGVDYLHRGQRDVRPLFDEPK